MIPSWVISLHTCSKFSAFLYSTLSLSIRSNDKTQFQGKPRTILVSNLDKMTVISLMMIQGNKHLTPSGEPDKCVFRNTPLVLAEAKTIHNNGDVGNKYVTPSGDPDKSAFRTAPLVLPEAKTIYGIEDTGNKFLTPSGGPDKSAYR